MTEKRLQGTQSEPISRDELTNRILMLVKREYYCAAYCELGPEALTDLIMAEVDKSFCPGIETRSIAHGLRLGRWLGG